MVKVFLVFLEGQKKRQPLSKPSLGAVGIRIIELSLTGFSLWRSSVDSKMSGEIKNLYSHCQVLGVDAAAAGTLEDDICIGSQGTRNPTIAGTGDRNAFEGRRTYCDIRLYFSPKHYVVLGINHKSAVLHPDIVASDQVLVAGEHDTGIPRRLVQMTFYAMGENMTAACDQHFINCLRW